jgi:uncharacterized protein YjdB
MTRDRPLLLLALGLAATLACATHDATSSFFPDECNIKLASITTLPPALAVGDTVTLHATLLGPSPCIPAGATNADLRWFTGDTAIVALDSITGLVHARKPGGAIISVGLKGQTAGLDAVEVRVAAP